MIYYKLPTIDDIDIQFRALFAEEADRFYTILKHNNTASAEDHIFNTITDNKYIDQDISAGTVPLVIYCAFKLSGVLAKKEDLPNLIDQSRSIISSNIYYILFGKIISTQSSYTLDQLKTKTLHELIELYTFAELIDGKQVIDTNKMRASFIKDEQEKANPMVKKGVKGITKEELDALKLALQCDMNNSEQFM